MEDTSGFYKLEDDNWQYAPNFVYGPSYELVKENKDSDCLQRKNVFFIARDRVQRFQCKWSCADD